MTLLYCPRKHAAGKSTLVKKLRAICRQCTVCFLQEPVDEWENIKNSSETMISLFYGDQHKYGFSFQMMVYFKTCNP